MESMDIPGKFQCLQSTVDLLVKEGKQHWVKACEDSAIAKGKGVLKTFLVDTICLLCGQHAFD